jgi:hypothetical protein
MQRLIVTLKWLLKNRSGNNYLLYTYPRRLCFSDMPRVITARDLL